MVHDLSYGFISRPSQGFGRIPFHGLVLFLFVCFIYGVNSAFAELHQNIAWQRQPQRHHRQSQQAAHVYAVVNEPPIEKIAPGVWSSSARSCPRGWRSALFCSLSWTFDHTVVRFSLFCLHLRTDAHIRMSWIRACMVNARETRRSQICLSCSRRALLIELFLYVSLRPRPAPPSLSVFLFLVICCCGGCREMNWMQRPMFAPMKRAVTNSNKAVVVKMRQSYKIVVSEAERRMAPQW